MTEKKIIAVVGATGVQGGGLLRAILADPDGPFTARALTRNTGSDRARELASPQTFPNCSMTRWSRSSKMPRPSSDGTGGGPRRPG
jgi:hypothetical protein